MLLSSVTSIATSFHHLTLYIWKHNRQREHPLFIPGAEILEAEHTSPCTQPQHVGSQEGILWMKGSSTLYDSPSLGLYAGIATKSYTKAMASGNLFT